MECRKSPENPEPTVSGYSLVVPPRKGSLDGWKTTVIAWLVFECCLPNDRDVVTDAGEFPHPTDGDV